MELLSIGEFSKLMNISTHNLRYYEKEGLLKPKHRDSNGYRYYDKNDLYTVSVLLLLRDHNIPIKEIKDLITDYDKNRYIDLLTASKIKIDEQINSLLKIKNQIEKGIDLSKTIQQELDKTFNINLDKKYLKLIKKDFKNDSKLLRVLYDYNKDNQKTFHDQILYLKVNENSEDLYGEVFDDSYDIIIPSGDYISHKLIITEKDDPNKKVENILYKMGKNVYDNIELFFVKIDNQASIFTDNGEIIEILLKLS